MTYSSVSDRPSGKKKQAEGNTHISLITDYKNKPKKTRKKTWQNTFQDAPALMFPLSYSLEVLRPLKEAWDASFAANFVFQNHLAGDGYKDLEQQVAVLNICLVMGVHLAVLLTSLINHGYEIVFFCCIFPKPSWYWHTAKPW